MTGGRSVDEPIRTAVLAASERPQAEAIWREIEERLERPGIACSWDWTSSWLEHFGDLVAHRFVLGRRGDRPVGIVLLVEDRAHRRGPLTPRRLNLGTVGTAFSEMVWVERNQLLVADEDRAQFAASLLAHLGRDRRWDRLVLQAFLPEHAAALSGSGLRVIARTEDSPVADLRGGDVLDVLPASTRRRVRGTLRRFGPLETDWATTAEEAEQILEDLIRLHGARWAAEGQSGAFATPRIRAFHRAVVSRLLPREEAVLFRVRRGEETVGCVLGYAEGERMLFYQGGLARYDDNRLRPGLATHVLCMGACRERGLVEYDFLAPGSRYKYELSNRTDRLVWVELERSRVRMRVRRGLGELARSGRARVGR